MNLTQIFLDLRARRRLVGVVTKPHYLLVLQAGVALLVGQAIIINRLAGVRYPIWASVPTPKIGALASRGALQRFTHL